MPKKVVEPIILLACGDRVIGWSRGQLMGDEEWCNDTVFASETNLPQYLYHDGPFVKANLDGTLLEVFSALYYFAGDRTRILHAPDDLLECIVTGYSENMSTDVDEEDPYYIHNTDVMDIDIQKYMA